MNSTIENVLITPEMAFEILGQSDTEYQRPLRKKQVEFLAREMKAGRFLSNTIALCVNGSDKKHLVNGQHTLNAIFESGVSLELPVQTYHIDGKDDVASIYARIDKQMKRSRADTFRAYGMEERLGMGYTDVNRFGACGYYVLNNFKDGHGNTIISEQEVIDFMLDWNETARAYFSHIENTGLVRVAYMRREVFAVGLLTCRHSKQAADFWKYTASDDGLFIGDPRKTLHQWMKDSGVSGGNGSQKRKVVSTAESIRSVALAWNAYIDERTLKIIRIVNPTLPFTIKDTPYKNIA
jgi:hypothetical protein